MRISMYGYFPEPEKCRILENAMSIADPSVTESRIPEILREAAGSIFGPDVGIEVTETPRKAGKAVAADFYVALTWVGKRIRFAAKAKARSTPRAVEEAIMQAQVRGRETGRPQMIVVPFLGEQWLNRLLKEGLSGLDLSGNGIVVVPGQLLLRQSGCPNRYPESRPARFAYRGASSLVPRVFLRRSRYPSVTAIREEIESGGAAVAMSTVSKALARMAEDVAIDRTRDGIRLIQGETILDLLAEDFVTPKPLRALGLKWSASLSDLFQAVAGKRRSQSDQSDRSCKLVMSGTSSQARYSAGMRADTPILYASDLAELQRRLGKAWEPSERFTDLRVIQTDDPTVFFDARIDDNAVAYASPVQAYLELTASGDKRDNEIASQIREQLLRTVASQKHSPP